MNSPATSPTQTTAAPSPGDEALMHWLDRLAAPRSRSRRRKHADHPMQLLALLAGGPDALDSPSGAPHRGKLP